MAAGFKTGGRAKGTPNKVKTDAPAPVGAADPEYLSSIKSSFPRYRLARVDSLIAYDKNPRTHSPAQVDLLAKLITEFGWTNPVLVDGKRGVVAGHGRVLAARKLGMDVVPTIELSHLSDAQRRAYVIADNQSALTAGWDDELLAGELLDLREEGFDLALTGFDSDELDGMLEADAGEEGSEEVTLDGKVCCPACGHEFATVNKAFRLIAAKASKAAA